MDDHSDKSEPNPSGQRSRTYLSKVINLDEDTKHDKLDDLVTRVFPTFVLACCVFIVILMILLNNYTLAGILYSICLGFVIGFVVFGLVCMFLSDRGVITAKYVVPFMIAIPAVVSLILYLLGDSFGPNAFMVRFFDVFGGSPDLVSIMVSVYSIALMMFLVAYGVVSVIVGYFRRYFYRILRALEYPPEKRKNHIPEWLFQIPDIIDIESVELEPAEDDDGFNVVLFRNTAFSLFILGTVICSYIFINPLFLQTIPFDEMLLIGVLLSLFISPLVIPWSIVKSVGAKVRSSAPRDFYLWKGMRGRLYQGFFAVTFFMMLLTMSVYLGMDFSRIVTTYLGYLTFMGLISIVTSFVYVNTYYKGFKNGIVKSYTASKLEK